ncbi:C4-dicarboxylate ABC transporter substrate-binding protein [Thioclava sp. SK-1]|uniref:tripartite tricarboxylate transporter substrate binding protein n=1 Tax=Thioclava sp. SK-1 TaxID=1889770 RepID=UPI000824E12F|nr:tripartite tricarboxylate transporter substrate binding protein [Thioclava sp. SK-1]OCX65749.1 C4-dicarboxylate ABC transporter substrate-binding protein [Thioclava sp. SK-1]
MKKISTLAAAAVAFATPALADYPERPIQIIVPYSAGGSTDLSIRLVAESLEKHMDGATVVVRNQPGGGGTIGTSAALHGRPDGYVLGAAAQGPLGLAPHLGGTDYTLADADFIGLFARSLQVLVACADAPFSDFDTMISYAQTTPVQVGNSGAGGANHISAEAFAKAADIQVESIPYPGSADARTACVGGHIDAMVASPAEALAASQAGQMTPIFVMEDARIDLFPDVPTAVEKGVDFTWSSWKGLIAPKGIDAAILASLRSAVEQVATDPEFVKKMTDMGELVTYEDADTFAQRAAHDSETAAGTIEDLGMTGMNN